MSILSILSSSNEEILILLDSRDTGICIGSGEINNSNIPGTQIGIVISGKTCYIGLDKLQSNEDIVVGNNMVGSNTGIRLLGEEDSICSNRISSNDSAIELRGNNNIATNKDLLDSINKC